jgi:hypothetical protein
MSAIVAIFFRVALVYLIIKTIWSLLTSKKNTSRRTENETAAKSKRFDAQGQNVVDAEFKDLK